MKEIPDQQLPYPLEDTHTSHRIAAIFSPGIQRVQWLREFLNFKEVVFRPGAKQAPGVDVVLTWGNKETGRAASDYARKYGKPLWRLEDGFFRSIQPGAQFPGASLVLDTQGIYYDARAPSSLETLLESDTALLDNPVFLQRASIALDVIRRERISKYNNSRCAEVSWPDSRQRVLVIDQTFGDASIRGGLASEATFSEMVHFALKRFPDAEIVLKTHPDAKTRGKSGYLSKWTGTDPRVRLHQSADNPYALLAQCAHVVTATSQFGFESLIQGVPVTCFGAPFYSGWGLTDDRASVARRTKKRSLEQLAVAALFAYSRYVDPVTGKRCELERVLEHFALQRRAFLKNEPRTLAVKISPWKRPAARRFLGSPTSHVTFQSEEKAFDAVHRDHYERLVVWGESRRLQSRCQELGIDYVRMEDGFLRSAQLGSDLTTPLSLVLDQSGMYYDATAPSDLEQMLSQRAFTQEEKLRGRRFREKLVALRLSKYNVQQDRRAAPNLTDRPTVLVIGQVGDDASIRLGTTDVDSNSRLVERVRQVKPNAHLVYKPHPDVISGNRPGALSNAAEKLVDHVETEAAVVACLDDANEVHTMTSLVGFEALLRNIPVFTYGMPFYAGWGLTKDAQVCPRRSRRIELDELVFAAFVAYPLYYSDKADCFVEAESIVEELASSRLSGTAASVAPSWSRKLRRWLRYLQGVTRER